MKNIELMSLSCACCGARLEDFQGKNEVTCDFCNNITRVIRPVNVNLSDSIDKNKKENFANLVAIMEQSMIAENYKEAYDYCNKALEIDPLCGTLWENKAICCFWLRTDNNIIESQAKEIITYLNAAKNNNPDSITYNSTVDNLSFNLYFAAWYRYTIVSPDSLTANNKPGYTMELVKKVVSYLNMMEIAFDLSPTELYLKDAIIELSGTEKIQWIDTNNNEVINLIDINKLGTNPAKLWERLIAKVKKVNPNYQEPAIWKKSGCFIATAAMGDYNHPVVVDLRTFRDEWLLKRKWGISFTNWYYTHGPKAASIIEQSKFLRKLTFCIVIKPLQVITKLMR